MSINRSLKRASRKPAKKKSAYGANTPVCSEACVEVLSTAEEIHQHNKYPHILMVVNAEHKHTTMCLFCGGTSMLSRPEGGFDEEGFQLFKTFHMNCCTPQQPVGLFNADVQA